MELKIYGVSDDLVEVEGDIREEYYADGYDGRTLFLAGRLGGQVVVKVQYNNEGEWDVSYKPVWEELPPWTFKMTHGDQCEYSTTLHIDTYEEPVKIIA